VSDADRLRRAGPRVTAARLAILGAVGPGDHLGTDEVARAARDRAGHLTRQATYGHHHLVCRRCGAVADVDRVTGPAPCLEPAGSGGFTIDEAEVTFWGVCPRCRARSQGG